MRGSVGAIGKIHCIAAAEKAAEAERSFCEGEAKPWGSIENGPLDHRRQKPRTIRWRVGVNAGSAAARAMATAARNEGGANLKTTRYFEEQVLRKRPYIQREWCRAVLAAPSRREAQGDGRIRFWGRIAEAGEARSRYLRVVTLEDGETIHNAFFDRNFRED
jgi:hypothetical protein